MLDCRICRCNLIGKLKVWQLNFSCLIKSIGELQNCLLVLIYLRIQLFIYALEHIVALSCILGDIFLNQELLFCYAMLPRICI